MFSHKVATVVTRTHADVRTTHARTRASILPANIPAFNEALNENITRHRRVLGQQTLLTLSHHHPHAHSEQSNVYARVCFFVLTKRLASLISLTVPFKRE